MAYLERSTFELTNYVNNHVAVGLYDEISLVFYDYAYGISSSANLYSEIENTSGSSANAESLPAVETAYSREPPPAPAVYVTTPQYVNTNHDNEADSAQETSYSGLESSTLEPPQVPAVYDTMITPQYVNENPDDPASSAPDSMIQPKYFDTNSDDAASSAVETSYSGLESSTQEPPPAPAVCDTMATPEYFNTRL